jgi:hypothetical protein
MVKGLPKLKVDLANLKDEILQAPIPALIAGADAMVTRAKALCVNNSVRSTIRHTSVLQTKRGNPVIRVQAGDASTLVGRTEKFQLARIIEYGTYGKGRAPAQQAHPFMRIAKVELRDKIKANMRKAIRAAIRAANHGS